MQKNCTEFIAYENVAPERSRPQKQVRGERPRAAAGTQAIDQALPLVERALKVLIDREVSPQLGLLKSTLLQLDSSFSERDYGASTFREFADKLAEHGLVTLREQGRSTLVELTGSAPPRVAVAATLAESGDAPSAEPTPLREILEQPDSGPGPAERSLGDGVALVRRALAETATPPRWPMYPRQFKQFLKNAAPEFDERRHGSINDLMRACQKDGLLRLERDRQGGLRVFAPGSGGRSSVPHGWAAHRERATGNGHGAADEAPAIETAVEVVPEPVIDAAIVSEEPPVAAAAEDAAEAAPKARRARARKTPAAEKTDKKKAAPRKKKAQ
jgi:hypothetical protein